MNERSDMDTEKQHCQTETHTKERTKMGSETATVFTGTQDFIYYFSNRNIRWKQNMTVLSLHKTVKHKVTTGNDFNDAVVYYSRDLETVAMHGFTLKF